METRSAKRRREQRERELREREEEEVRWQELAQRIRSLPPEVRRNVWTFSGICACCYQNTSPIYNEDYFVSFQEVIDENSLHNRKYPQWCRICNIIYCRECSVKSMVEYDALRRLCRPCCRLWLDGVKGLDLSGSHIRDKEQRDFVRWEVYN